MEKIIFMKKYSQEFKLKVVQFYLSGYGKALTGKQFNINASNVEKWVKLYQKFGETALIDSTNRQRFTTEFKHQVVLTVLEKNLSLREAETLFELKSKTVITRWLRQYRASGIEGLKAKTRERLNLMPKFNSDKEDNRKTQEELLEELAYLRAENAFLKKRRALRLEQEAREAAEQQHLRDLYQG